MDISKNLLIGGGVVALGIAGVAGLAAANAVVDDDREARSLVPNSTRRVPWPSRRWAVTLDDGPQVDKQFNVVSSEADEEREGSGDD